MTPSIVQQRLIEFAVLSGKVADKLPRTYMGIHIARQLIRSSTSPAANYAEACAAESKRDFIHKLSICLKELRESNTWFEIISKAGMIDNDLLKTGLDESAQLGKIIAKSIITAKHNLQIKT